MSGNSASKDGLGKLSRQAVCRQDEMHSTIRHGARLVTAAPRLSSAITTQSSPIAKAALWTCAECRFKAQAGSLHIAKTVTARNAFRRSFASSARLRDDGREHKKPIDPIDIPTPEDETHAKPTSPTTVTTPERPLPSKPSSLPSHAAERRWQLSKDMTRFIDQLLARASIAGQHINAYTGTDYSGIETLRTEIIEQEQKVKACHKVVDTAKSSHLEAYGKQGSAQKEIVSLLERKSSWSPTDLERYMNLVRSEHVHEQTVQAAKDNLASAERELEDARASLERLERKQYHEEQIWSDTIRRNSTWVTFGLMGFNIILLLAQILFFEPYRRRKIVREVKRALDEKTMSAPPAVEAERQVDEVVEPAKTPLETVGKAMEEVQVEAQALDTVAPAEESAGQTPLAAGEVLPEEAADVLPMETAPSAAPPNEEPIAASLMQEHQPAVMVQTPSKWDAYKESFMDLFSERLIQLKQVELTTIALQGAATGVAAMGLLFLLLRPK